MTNHVFTLESIPTPIGTMRVVSDREARLRALDWEDFEPRMRQLLRSHYGDAVELVAAPTPRAVREPLVAYFAGELGALDAIAVATGGTAFQCEVWAALRRIPVGETRGYAELAAALGKPNAVRAVGAANGANPIGIVVPCHRVIGADRSLTGYAGGLARKRWLLEHEGVQLRVEPAAVSRLQRRGVARGVA